MSKKHLLKYEVWQENYWHEYKPNYFSSHVSFKYKKHAFRFAKRLVKKYGYDAIVIQNYRKNNGSKWSREYTIKKELL